MGDPAALWRRCRFLEKFGRPPVRVLLQGEEQRVCGEVAPSTPALVGADMAHRLGAQREGMDAALRLEGELGNEGDTDAGGDQSRHEPILAGAAGDVGAEAGDPGQAVQDVAGVAPAPDP
jgi:hypothetical protein